MVKTNEKKILLVKNKQNSIKTKKKNVENCIFKEKKANNNCGYRKQLDSIAEKDPEFFRYLKEQEADLLDFNESDIDLSEDSDEHSVEMDISDSQQDVHMDDMYSGKTKLDQDGGRFIVNNHLILHLEKVLNQDNPPISAIKTAVDLFSACVARVGGDIELPNYIVNDGKLFERIVRMCFAHLGKLLFVKLKPVDSLNMKLKNGEKCRKIGKLSSNSVMYRFRKWKKYNSLVKSYLNYLLLFLNELQSPDVLVCTLHAITEVISLYGHFNKLTRNLIKSLVRIWSRKTDECRCAAFIAIFKFIRSNKSIYSAIIKACYFGYVTNVREVTPESWPLITFMQKSFAEICFIDIAISYQYAFMYIRQTAIHLRNAMIAKRKDLIQTVYNWQFIQCLYLWATVISRVARSEDRVYIRRDDIFQRLHGLMELAYPLCQITIATFKLYPSPKFLPLKLHCIRILLLLQVNCNIYIPALSLAVQLCDDAVNMVLKKPKKGKGTIRAVDITCMIKASSSHMEENGYRHKALDALFKVLLEAAYILRSSCAFPDLIVPLNVQIKSFISRCRSIKYANLFKSLNKMLNEHAQQIRLIMASKDIKLDDEECINHIERDLEASDLSLVAYYNSWQNIWKMQNDAINDAMQNKTTNNATGSDKRSSAVIKPKKEDKKNKNLPNKKYILPKINGKQNKEHKKEYMPEEKKLKHAIKKMLFSHNKYDDQLKDLVLSDSDG